ncbi:MAG: cysteine--tRNA ligase [Acidimicrobiales bacterium]
MLRLYDTAAGRVVTLGQRDPGRLSMYVCGPTVYGEPHLGHGRFNLVWDVLRRYLTWSGIEVRFVSNITDVDDKIIAAAAAAASTAAEVAAGSESLWWAVMDRLGVGRPTVSPHATAYVGSMVSLIAELVERGHAYPGGDGVYFATDSVDGYGLLARQPLESLRAGARVEPAMAAAKRSPVDFALWKRAKAGEPSWLSPWGRGRPGWHTECVAMALDLLGDGFDLHGGGSDLAFPHHENERAQAVGVGRAFARHWAHSGMVEAGGEKMAKSAGNTLSLTGALAAHDPRALRLLVLQSHYRGPMAVGEDNLSAADATLRGLDSFARDLAGARGTPVDDRAVEGFRGHMDDDLDTPAATAGVFDLVRRARAGAPGAAATVFELAENALGLPLGRPSEDIPAEVAGRLAERQAARASRDWSTADRIRDALAAEGWVIEDGASGTTVHR